MDVPLDLEWDPHGLIDHVEDTAFGGTSVHEPIAVDPQPDVAFVSMLAVPRAPAQNGRIPVLIHVHSEESFFTVACLHNRVTIDVVRETVGPLWKDGMFVFIGSACVPLQNHEVAMIRQGTLITVGSERDPWDRRLPLADKLKSLPTSGAAEDVVPDESAPTSMAIVGHDGRTRIVFSPNPWAEDAATVACDMCGLLPEDAHVCSSCRTPSDLLICGSRVRRVVGVVPKLQQGICCVFIDARDLHCPIQVLQLKSQPVRIADIIARIGAVVPASTAVQVEGAPFYDAQAMTFFPAHAALIVIRLERICGPAEGSHHCPSIEDVRDVGLPGMWNRTPFYAKKHKHCAGPGTPLLGRLKLPSACIMTLMQSIFECKCPQTLCTSGIEFIRRYLKDSRIPMLNSNSSLRKRRAMGNLQTRRLTPLNMRPLLLKSGGYKLRYFPSKASRNIGSCGLLLERIRILF